MANKPNNHASQPKAHGEPFDRSSFTVIRAEDLDAIAQIQAGLVAHYQPANSEELFAIERIALGRHSLLRTYRMESGLVSYGLQKASQVAGVPQILSDPEDPGEPRVTAGQKSSFWIAAGFCEANRVSLWQFFLRYQAQTERFYRRAVEDFERLRRHRAPSPEQTVVEPAPEPAAAKPSRQKPASPPVNEPKKQPTIEHPARQQQRPDPPAVPNPAQPAAVLSHRRRRVLHVRVPTRAGCFTLRTKVLPAAGKAVETGFPNAP